MVISVYRQLFTDVLSRRGVSADKEARIKEIHKQAKGCSTANSEKKDRILLKLFTHHHKTCLLVQVYRGMLQQHQSFVKLFQCEKLVLHKLHVKMYCLTRDFLSLFLRAEVMPQEHSVSALKKVDCSKPENQVSDKDLVVGKYACSLYQKLRADPKQQHWLKKFQQDLRRGYTSACVAMLEKLPLSNRTLANLTALDPEMQQCEDTARGLIQLAEHLPNVISDKEAGQLQMEARQYTCDSDIKSLAFTESDEIDKGWWHLVSQLRATVGDGLRYPVLSKLVKAVLTVFSGPVIEGTFNIMDDIIENDRTALTTESFEAIAVTKYALKAKKETCCSMTITHKMRVSATSAHAKYVEFLEHKKCRVQKRRQELIEQAVNNLKSGSEKSTAKSQAATMKFGFTIPKKTSVNISHPPKKAGEHACSAEQTSVPNSKFVRSTTSSENTSHPTDRPGEHAPKNKKIFQKFAPTLASAKSSATKKTDKNTLKCNQDAGNNFANASGSEASSTTSRRNFFEHLSQELQHAAQSSFVELQRAAKEAGKAIVNRWPVCCLHGLEASSYKEDCCAADLYPNDAPPLIPVKICGDGNCLPRSASLLASGSEDQHVEMRVRMTIELAVNEEFYLSDENLKDPDTSMIIPWSKHYATYSEELEDEKLEPGAIRDIFRKEVLKSILPGRYLGMWFLHAISSILCNPIQSIYPQYGGHTVRKHLQRKICPRIYEHDSQTSRLPAIMWTHMYGKDLPENKWEPNHFVVCLPGKNVHPSAKRKAPQDIRDFFAKKAKQ